MLLKDRIKKGPLKALDGPLSNIKEVIVVSIEIIEKDARGRANVLSKRGGKAFR